MPLVTLHSHRIFGAIPNGEASWTWGHRAICLNLATDEPSHVAALAITFLMSDWGSLKFIKGEFGIILALYVNVGSSS